MNNEDNFATEELAFPLEPTKQIEVKIPVPQVSQNLFASLQKPAIFEVDLSVFDSNLYPNAEASQPINLE